MMKPNAIILTSGLTGSSVLAGLIARAGHWTGDRTHKKDGAQKNDQYNTYENTELIDLNQRLLQQAGYRGNFSAEFSWNLIRSIADLTGAIDDHDYKAFLAKCDAHQPWIWKDPRLWVTIRFWAKLSPLDGCRFILLTRGPVQSWVSATLRRQIRTFRHLTQYEDNIKASLIAFLEEHRFSWLPLSYEALIQRPSEALDKLNRHLSSNLTTDDLRKVYTKPLYRPPRSPLSDYAKAALIYLWNYSKRIDVPAGRG